MNPNCEHVRDLLPELVSAQLDASESARLRAHIESCAECQAEYALASVIAGRRYSYAAAFEERVLAATMNRRVGFWSPGRKTLAASIAVMVMGGSVLIGSPFDPKPDPEPVAVETGAGPVENARLIRVEDALPTGASLGDLTVEELERLLAEMGS
jgi:anti-sigma factor RsiW